MERSITSPALTCFTPLFVMSKYSNMSSSASMERVALKGKRVDFGGSFPFSLFPL